MIDFDYNENKVVGYVDFIPATNNAKIEVVGYTDLKNDFHQLSEREAIELFPNKGKIFAHNFAERFHHTKGTLVCLSVKVNEKVGDYLEAYVWDKSAGVYEYGSSVKRINGSFTANGQYNYNILRDNNLLDLKNDRFIFSGGLIYLIKAESQERLISYWKPGSLDTLEIHGRLFVTDSKKRVEDGKIDITTDDQLMEWYLKNILKKNWSQIFEEKTFGNVEPLIRDAFSVSKGLDGIVVGSRIKRLTHINRVLTFSFEALNELKSLPWLKDSIEQSVSAHKEAFLNDIEVEKSKKLKEITEKYELEILLEKERVEKEKKELSEQLSDIDEKIKANKKKCEDAISEKQLELEIIEEKLNSRKKEADTLEGEISRLEKKKDDIIEDFSIVKEVLGINNVSLEETAPKQHSIEDINLSEEAIPVYQAFIKSIENTLTANHIAHKAASSIGNQLAIYKTILVPDVAIAKIIALATKKCRYSVEYVSATWKSFEDLWQNGLGFIVDECSKNQGIMHYLILQNINLSYLPNYMMPLIDIQRGITSKFPGVNTQFPDNLRIFCTTVSDDVMPMNENCLKFIGCVDKSVAKDDYGIIEAPENTSIGYLPPTVIKGESKTAKNVPNFYKDYLDNE